MRKWVRRSWKIFVKERKQFELDRKRTIPRKRRNEIDADVSLLIEPLDPVIMSRIDALGKRKEPHEQTN